MAGNALKHRCGLNAKVGVQLGIQKPRQHGIGKVCPLRCQHPPDTGGQQHFIMRRTSGKHRRSKHRPQRESVLDRWIESAHAVERVADVLPFIRPMNQGQGGVVYRPDCFGSMCPMRLQQCRSGRGGQGEYHSIDGLHPLPRHHTPPPFWSPNQRIDGSMGADFKLPSKGFRQHRHSAIQAG